MSFPDMPGYSQGDQIDDVSLHVGASAGIAGSDASVNAVLGVSWAIIIVGLAALWAMGRVFR